MRRLRAASAHLGLVVGALAAGAEQRGGPRRTTTDTGGTGGGATAPGALVGVIALEDALEQLVGEVRDPAHRQPVA